VIDNFSRRILAWKVSGTFNPSVTAEILLTASKSVSVRSAEHTFFSGRGPSNYDHLKQEVVDGRWKAEWGAGACVA
jgi:hypothetical protein